MNEPVELKCPSQKNFPAPLFIIWYIWFFGVTFHKERNWRTELELNGLRRRVVQLRVSECSRLVLSFFVAHPINLVTDMVNSHATSVDSGGVGRSLWWPPYLWNSVPHTLNFGPLNPKIWHPQLRWLEPWTYPKAQTFGVFINSELRCPTLPVNFRCP